MRVGLYGGIFDPIHNAHLLIAQFIKEDLKLDKVIFIPSGIPLHKKVFWPADKRLKMVKTAVADNPFFEISTLEIENVGVSYSVDTIQKLKAELKLPKEDLIWIVGSDNFVDFDKWKNPTRIFELCTVVVFPRTAGDYARAPEEFSSKAIYLKHAPIIEISSTQVRDRVAKGQSVKYFVPQVIEGLVSSSHSA